MLYNIQRINSNPINQNQLFRAQGHAKLARMWTTSKRKDLPFIIPNDSKSLSDPI